MAKKKTAKIQKKAPRQKVDTKFDCPFCSFSKSVECKLNKKTMIGYVACKVCGQKFETNIIELSIPADVYCAWTDACNEANQF